MKNLKLIVLPVAAIAWGSASAQTAYDSFGSANGGFDYQTGSGWAVTGAASGVSNFGQAFEFSSAATGQLSQLIVAFANDSNSGEADILIYADNGSNSITGPAIYSWTNVPTDGTFGSYFAPVTLTATGGPTLTAGANYWLVGVAPGANNAVFDVLNQSNNGAYQAVNHYYSTDGGNTWNSAFGAVDAAFEVNLSRTPEPSAVALIGLGAFALIRRRRR